MLLVALTGCPEQPHPRAPVAAVVTPVSAVAVDGGSELELLERDVNTVLRSHCSQCHAWSTWGLVRTRSACASGGTLVVPFEPARSHLHGKVAGAPACGGPMPPTGRLPQAAVDAIRMWILRGAPVGGKVTDLAVTCPDCEKKHAPPIDWAPDPN